MALIQGGGSSAGVANVDSNFNLAVNPPTDPTKAGYATQSAIIDTGAVTASVLARRILATPQGRMEVSQPTPLLTDTFTYAAQDTSRWKVSLTTMTATYSGGYLTLNASAITTVSTWALNQSYFNYPIPTEGTLVCRHFLQITATPATHQVMEWGMVYLPNSTAAPTDGVFFRSDGSGSLFGVTSYNGSEQSTAAITFPSINVSHLYVIVMDESHVEFWIDGVLQATILSPTSQGQPMQSATVTVAERVYNQAIAPTTSAKLLISDVDLWQTDGNLNRPSIIQRPCMGLMGYQGVGGMVTMQSQALYANSANPTAAVPTNTTAALGSGLGGNFWETASLAVNTDGIISSYQVAAAAVGTPGRKLIVTGLTWMSMVQTVLAGGPFIYQCALAFGHTAVSLAQAESTNAKARRIVPIGLYTLPATAAVGTLGANFNVPFPSPIVVNAGEFIATLVRNIGTVGTSGTIAHVIGINAHWD